MRGARKFSDYLKKELGHKGFKREFDREEVYANLAIQIAKLRQDNGFTQQELAEMLHTTQQTISRLEDPGNESFSVNTLIELAEALHKKLKIQFV
ncbi:helix-turn-helix domain-containing protein [Candidatus Omnitrophota bacterium]